jgi:hypothetical protein
MASSLLLRRRNVKAESLEFEQVQELLEVRAEEDGSYKDDWSSNRQRALALVAHIVESAPRHPADQLHCTPAIIAAA